MTLDLKNPAPLYRQIVGDIKSKIVSGELSEDDRIGSHQQLAQEYEVSLITVKKALSELINQGVLYSRVGKGTFVAARSPFVIHSKHKTIGIVLNKLTNPFFSLIVHSFEEKAYEMGYNILLSTSSDRIDKEEIQIRRFRELGVDGLLIASLSHTYRATPIIRKLHEENFPYMMVSYVGNSDIYYVGTDHEKGAFLATEHLIKLGFKKVGYINGEEGNLVGELRKKGYLRALQEYNLEYRDDFVFRLRLKGGENDYRSGYEIGELFGDLPDKPDAMFVYNDLSALGFQQALLNQRIRVPEDVAIVGFDNIKRGKIAPVPLTTVSQPTHEIGELAFDTLSKRVDGVQVVARTILPPRMIIRKSCGAKLKDPGHRIKKERSED